MNTTSETLSFTALLLLFGILALYGGAQWLIWLIPAAIAVWLIASARRHNRRDAIDAQAHNRAIGR
ncbi:MAG: hypothetical protein ABSF59_10670 [Candidatus Sulfotelmatobacter sp.]|jgi:hypothetical protein